jgi:hypothetical protein
MTIDYRRLLLDMFQAAVNAAAPALCVPAHLPPLPKGRTIVVGAGKAAASMAAAVEADWNGPIEGLAVTRYGHGVPCKHIEVVEASHPVPERAFICAKGGRPHRGTGLDRFARVDHGQAGEACGHRQSRCDRRTSRWHHGCAR